MHKYSILSQGLRRPVRKAEQKEPVTGGTTSLKEWGDCNPCGAMAVGALCCAFYKRTQPVGLKLRRKAAAKEAVAPAAQPRDRLVVKGSWTMPCLPRSNLITTQLNPISFFSRSSLYKKKSMVELPNRH